MRRSILFLALCSALDEASTFVHLSLGGIELNPMVVRLLAVSPLLYPLCDAAIILAFWTADRILGVEDLWLVWAAVGVARLVCFAFSQI